MKYNQNFKINQVDEATLVVGIDIGSREHYVRAFDWRGRELAKTFSFSNTLSGFEAFNSWIQAICTREEKTKTVAGIEPTGHYWFNLGSYLEAYGMVIAMVNPYHVKQTKELDDNSPTKNDKKDPKTIAKLVIEGRFSFPYIPKEVYAELRIAVGCRDKVVKEIGRIKNSISRWLSIYFPEYEGVYRNTEAISGIMVLKQAAFPKEIVELGAEKINQIWRTAKLRAVGMNKAKELVEAAKQSVGSKEGSIAAKLELRTLMEDYEHKMKQYTVIMETLEELCKTIPETEEMLAIKGVGLATVAGFVAEVGDIRRFESPRQIQKLAGYALKENSSGKHKGQTTISKRGRSRLRGLLFKAVIPLVAKNEEFAELHKYYTNRKENPLKKKQSLVAICCKLIRIFYAILTKGIVYDGEKMKADIHRPMQQIAA